MNKTILITGSSRGIGKAIAQLAHKENYRVILHGKTDSEALDKTHKELNNSIKTHFDISNKEEVDKGIQSIIDKVGNIDVLINNAGVVKNFITDISEMCYESAREEWETNVLGTIHCVQAVIPHMLKSKIGNIINMSSIKGYSNLSTMSTFTYGQTKAAIISMTKSLAKKYTPQGIRINCVSPGYIETDHANMWNEETFRKINEGTLLKRIGLPEEIAHLVLFLASDKSSYITGANFLADGGYTIQGK